MTEKLRFQVTYFNYLTLKATYDWMKEGKREPKEVFTERVVSCIPRDLEPYFNPEHR